MSGEINQGTYYKKEKYISDIERIHKYIILNNLQTEPKQKEEDIGHIFSIEGDHIHHYKIGLLNYRKSGLKDPKYIQMFKNIITYMPAGTSRIRVSELERIIPKKEQTGTNYRNNLGRNAVSFNNFLKKNGAKNSHPKLKTKIIDVTDEYITFNNKI
jgi:hypothetical protein